MRWPRLRELELEDQGRAMKRSLAELQESLLGRVESAHRADPKVLMTLQGQLSEHDMARQLITDASVASFMFALVLVLWTAGPLCWSVSAEFAEVLFGLAVSLQWFMSLLALVLWTYFGSIVDIAFPQQKRSLAFTIRPVRWFLILHLMVILLMSLFALGFSAPPLDEYSILAWRLVVTLLMVGALISLIAEALSGLWDYLERRIEVRYAEANLFWVLGNLIEDLSKVGDGPITLYKRKRLLAQFCQAAHWCRALGFVLSFKNWLGKKVQSKHELIARNVLGVAYQLIWTTSISSHTSEAILVPIFNSLGAGDLSGLDALPEVETNEIEKALLEPKRFQFRDTARRLVNIILPGILYMVVSSFADWTPSEGLEDYLIVAYLFWTVLHLSLWLEPEDVGQAALERTKRSLQHLLPFGD